MFRVTFCRSFFKNFKMVLNDLNIPMYESQGIQSNIFTILVLPGKHRDQWSFMKNFKIDSKLFPIVLIYLCVSWMIFKHNRCNHTNISDWFHVHVPTNLASIMLKTQFIEWNWNKKWGYRTSLKFEYISSVTVLTISASPSHRCNHCLFIGLSSIAA